jgi:hypothetical protein
LFLVDRLLYERKRHLEGDLLANQHTPSRDSMHGREVVSGFSGTYQGDDSKAVGTTLVGSRSLSFRATLRRLADN